MGTNGGQAGDIVPLFVLFALLPLPFGGIGFAVQKLGNLVHEQGFVIPDFNHSECGQFCHGGADDLNVCVGDAGQHGF